VQPLLGPLIRGEERTLTVDEQRLLATWAAKTALMLDLASSKPLIPVGFFHALRQQRRPLDSHIVWIGAYHGTSRAIFAEQYALHVGISSDDPANGFVTTLVVGRCLFQVVGHFTRGGAEVRDTRLLGAGLWSIWPPRGDAVDWPRQRLAFDDDALAELATSISG
jgi:hypothetical protein